VGFAGALLTPILLFASVLIWFYVSTERDRAIERTDALAGELTRAIDREMDVSDIALKVLATEPTLRRGDLAAFYPRAKDIANALGVTIVVRSPGVSQQLLNTSVPWGTQVKGGGSGNSEV